MKTIDMLPRLFFNLESETMNENKREPQDIKHTIDAVVGRVLIYIILIAIIGFFGLAIVGGLM